MSGFTTVLGGNETTEVGYAYAKKVFVKETFQPPLEVKHPDYSVWKIPGVLKTGVKLDVVFSYADSYISGYGIGLVDYLGEERPGKPRQFIMEFLDDRIGCYEIYDNGSRTESREIIKWSKWSSKSGSMYMAKMSLLAQTDSVQIFANDVELLTYQLKIRNIDTMKKIYVFKRFPFYAPVFIDRFQFTGTIN